MFLRGVALLRAGMPIAPQWAGIAREEVMELRDVDQFVREGKYDQALRAIDTVRSLDPHNPYTAAYEVRVRALLEEAARNPPEPTKTIPASAPRIQHEFPSVESQMRSIATAIPADRPRGTVSTNTAGDMERIAVLSRIADLLGSATGSLSRGEYDRALMALEQARVLDPGNTEIAVFEDRVRAAHHEAKVMHLVPEGAAGGSVDSVLSEIPAMLAAAREAATRGDFSEALRSVTTAGILEPANEEVARCEAEIRAVQEERRREEERRSTGTRAKREQADRAAREEIADADQERRHTSAIIARHVAAAQTLMNAGEYGHALVEIDHAFLLNPLDADVRRLQQEIGSAQERAARETDDASRTRAVLIASYLADAHRSRMRGKPGEALQAIGRILFLEPAHEEALGFERQLQAEIAAAAPLRKAPASLEVLGAGRLPDAQPGRDNGSRRYRTKTYLLAASLLATAVVVLLSLTQVLSHADGRNFIPEPSPVGTPADPGLIATESPSPADTAKNDAASAQGSNDRVATGSGRTAETVRGGAPQAGVIPGVLRLEQPDLPEVALGSNATELVTVKVLVDSTGRAMLAAIVVSTNTSFDQPVINAAMRSTYAPWQGGVVSKWITIPFTFTN
jgi:tetratricopeptide (TPR) repeat protein